MNLLFMGTSDFAVAALDALVKANMKPCAVISQPDKPKGRGYELSPTPVSIFASSQEIPLYKPQTLKDGAILPLLEELKPDIIVVAAYGKILPEYVLDYPRYGCINIHASLLPKYRGTAPINFALINGETKTGITTMFMDKGIDTGNMILKAETEINEKDDYGSLHNRLAIMGGDLIVKTINKILSGTSPSTPQQGEGSYAPLIDNNIRKIDFKQPSVKIINLIRGLSPIPAAFCFADGKNLKIFSAVISTECFSATPGTVKITDKFLVKTGDGTIEIKELQLEGKKKMKASDFLRGNKVSKLE